MSPRVEALNNECRGANHNGFGDVLPWRSCESKMRAVRVRRGCCLYLAWCQAKGSD